MTHRIRNTLIALCAFAAGGCAPKVNPDVQRVAKFYAERYADTTHVSPDDSASIKLEFTKAELDSVTRDWTASDWEQFWAAVQEARKP